MTSRWREENYSGYARTRFALAAPCSQFTRRAPAARHWLILRYDVKPRPGITVA
jgi:hypothetical protein